MRAREADYASAVAATARLAGRPIYPLAASSFPPPSSSSSFRTRARSFPPSLLLPPLLSFRPSRFTVSRWISPPPSLLVAIVESPANFSIFHVTPSPLLFSPPWKKSRGSFLPSFPNYIENVDTIISERYVVYSSTSETGDLVIEGKKKEEFAYLENG